MTQTALFGPSAVFRQRRSPSSTSCPSKRQGQWCTATKGASSWWNSTAPAGAPLNSTRASAAGLTWNRKNIAELPWELMASLGAVFELVHAPWRGGPDGTPLEGQVYQSAVGLPDRTRSRGPLP